MKTKAHQSKTELEKTIDILGAKTIENKYGYELLCIDIGDGRGRPYLKMTNPSVGTVHIEGVHPDCKTVESALNFRNNLESYAAPIQLS